MVDIDELPNLNQGESDLAALLVAGPNQEGRDHIIAEAAALLRTIDGLRHQLQQAQERFSVKLSEVNTMNDLNLSVLRRERKAAIGRGIELWGYLDYAQDEYKAAIKRGSSVTWYLCGVLKGAVWLAAEAKAAEALVEVQQENEAELVNACIWNLEQCPGDHCNDVTRVHDRLLKRREELAPAGPIASAIFSAQKGCTCGGVLRHPCGPKCLAPAEAQEEA